MNLDSIFKDATAKRAISPQSANNTTINGEVIDLANAEAVAFLCATGAQDAVVTYKIQTGTASDGSDMADLSGASQAFSATDDNKVTILELKQPTKRYARVAAVVANGTAQLIGAIALVWGKKAVPVTQDLGGNLTVAA